MVCGALSISSSLIMLIWLLQFQILLRIQSHAIPEGLTAFLPYKTHSWFSPKFWLQRVFIYSSLTQMAYLTWNTFIQSMAKSHISKHSIHRLGGNQQLSACPSHSQLERTMAWPGLWTTATPLVRDFRLLHCDLCADWLRPPSIKLVW